MTIDFQPFPKIARLNRDIVITEKIDGTNAAIVIVEQDNPSGANFITNLAVGGVRYTVYAQSRSRFITPIDDNYGFAGWAYRNAEYLVALLGPGTHFGEWWGSGIQRKYGLTGADKRFSLFNTGRWAHDGPDGIEGKIPGLVVVPIIFEGPFSGNAARNAIALLRDGGSLAAPGFMRPEGIVIWHEAARQLFKVTLEKDAAPKGIAAHALDEEKAA